MQLRGLHGEATNVSLKAELEEDLFDRTNDEGDVAVVLLEDAVGDAMIEEVEKLVVEAVDIDQHDRLLMDPERLPGKDFEHLFERAVASGKDEEGVGEIAHHRLAGMHGAGDVKLGDAAVGDLKIHEDLGNDSDDATSEGKSGFGDGLHETDIRSAVDDADVALGEFAAELDGCLAIGRVDSIGGGAEDGYVRDHSLEDIKSSLREGR